MNRKIIKYEKQVPKGLSLGLNRIIEDGKTVRIYVRESIRNHKDTDRITREYKIREYRR